MNRLNKIAAKQTPASHVSLRCYFAGSCGGAEIAIALVHYHYKVDGWVQEVACAIAFPTISRDDFYRLAGEFRHPGKIYNGSEEMAQHLISAHPHVYIHYNIRLMSDELVCNKVKITGKMFDGNNIPGLDHKTVSILVNELLTA